MLRLYVFLKILLLGEARLKHNIESELIYRDKINSGSSGRARSIYQFKEQSYGIRISSRIILELFSLIFVFFLILLGSFGRLIVARTPAAKSIFQGDENLFEQYKDYFVKCDNEQIIFSPLDGFRLAISCCVLENLIAALWRSKSFYFCGIVTFKIMSYQYLINRYDPATIYASTEFSFSSSWATEFLSGLDIDHWNVMHGDKVINKRDAYCKYSGVVFWHEHYESIAHELGWVYEERAIFCPDPFKNLCLRDNKTVLYYLPANPSQVGKLTSTIECLLSNGYVVLLKEHPKARERRLVRLIVKRYPEIVLITNQIHLDRVDLVIEFVSGQFSSAVLLACFNGVPYAFDDISNFSRTRLEISGLFHVTRGKLSRLSKYL